MMTRSVISDDEISDDKAGPCGGRRMGGVAAEADPVSPTGESERAARRPAQCMGAIAVVADPVDLARRAMPPALTRVGAPLAGRVAPRQLAGEVE